MATKPIETSKLYAYRFSDVFPPADDEQMQRLEADIGKRGIMVPLRAWRSGSKKEPRYCVIAGHDRLRVARKLGLRQVPVDVIQVKNEDELFEHFIKDNTLRKDINKQDVARAVWERYPDKTITEIAKIAGVSKDTAHRARPEDVATT